MLRENKKNIIKAMGDDDSTPSCVSLKSLLALGFVVADVSHNTEMGLLAVLWTI